MTGPLQPIHAEVRARLEALKAGETPTGSVLTDDEVRAALDAGNVARVVIFCDKCGEEHRADYIGGSREGRFAAARSYLATQGWRITDEDLCPDCAKEER